MANANPKPAQETTEQASKAGVAPIQLTGSERKQRQSTIDRMRDMFAAQPKVRVRLAEDTPVQINGYKFMIKGKVTVEVPELVAEVLEQSGLY